MQIGQKVVGKYCGGHDFSGVITAARPVTVKTDGAMLFDVALDNEITVYGQPRQSLSVCTLWSGAPSSYNRYGDSMQVQS